MTDLASYSIVVVVVAMVLDPSRRTMGQSTRELASNARIVAVASGTWCEAPADELLQLSIDKL